MRNKAHALKRLIDIVGSSLFLLVGPFIAVCALLIKGQDGGPVFHHRRVVGPPLIPQCYSP